MNIEYRIQWAHTGIKPEHHQGVVLDKLELADLSFVEGDGGEGSVPRGADTVDRVQNGAVNVDCQACQIWGVRARVKASMLHEHIDLDVDDPAAM